MIKSFADKQTALVFLGKVAKRLPGNIQKRAKAQLNAIQAASDIEDLRVPPGNRLEKLSGNRVGQHSIRINQQWRICFIWRNGEAYEVEICDYH